MIKILENNDKKIQKIFELYPEPLGYIVGRDGQRYYSFANSVGGIMIVSESDYVLKEIAEQSLERSESEIENIKINRF